MNIQTPFDSFKWYQDNVINVINLAKTEMLKKNELQEQNKQLNYELTLIKEENKRLKESYNKIFVKNIWTEHENKELKLYINNLKVYLNYKDNKLE